MKSPSLDSLYIQLHKSIVLAESYTEFDKLAFIIKACRLKPTSYVFEERETKAQLYRQWFDEAGNSIKITNQKKIKVIYNNLSLDRNKIISTDLYYGLSLDKIVKISKLLHLCLGKDEDLYQDCFIITLLGIDNYLRSYMYLYDEWQQVSPLLLGMKNLQIIGKNVDIQYFREFTKKENCPIHCVNGRQWLSFMPASSDFVELVYKQCDKLLPFLHK